MRWVDLPGCGHFRDVGGYRTVDGSKTKWGVLYRSASLDSLTDSGTDALRELDVQTVVDLRTGDERVSPPPWNHDRKVEVISLPASNPAASTLRAGLYDPGALYVASIEDRRRDFPHILSVLANPDRAP